jgi:dipeptidyl aminopeptidase/acylaminoacyl peptidase
MPDAPIQPFVPEVVTPTSNRKKVLIGICVSLFLIIFGSSYAYYLNQTAPPQGGVPGRALLDPPASPKPSSTPFPFEELTVPALRAKVYQSQLGERQRLADNGRYTSYLSSFTSDGYKVNGLLTIPDGVMPVGGWPAIIFIHGYIPPNQYQTTSRYTDHVAALAGSGFVVFKIDLRGHGDSEGEPGGGYFGSDYVTDTLNARAALQVTDFVNKDLIGLWGHSMAGNVVLRAMAARPEIPASVIWAGAVYTYTDMQEYGISDNSYSPQPSDSERQRRRQQLRELYGNPTPDSWFWKLVAPANYLADMTGALQIDHAVNDDVVSIEYSRNLAKLIPQTGLKFELKEYPTGGHNITGASFNAAMQNTINFFKEHLK